MRRTTKAFTMAELMVVVAIIALLGSGSFVLYDRFRTRSRDILKRREAFLAQRAMELHRRFEGRSPRDARSLVRKGYLSFRSHEDEDRWLAMQGEQRKEKR